MANQSPEQEKEPTSADVAEKLAEETPNAFVPQQFQNPANPEIHRNTTAEEIWNDLDGAAERILDDEADEKPLW